MDVARAGGRIGDGRRREHRRVDAVGGVGERGVPVGLFGGGRRGARVGPAVGVRADQGADPFAERVAVPGRVRGFDAVQEVAVGDSFRGERAARREFVQPEAGHVRGGEVLAVALEEQEVQEGVVEVVVLRHAVDVLGEGGGRGAAVPGVGGFEVRGRPRSVNQVVRGQLPVALASALMPSRGSFSTGLPSRQPAALPSQAASRRGWSVVGVRDAFSSPDPPLPETGGAAPRPPELLLGSAVPTRSALAERLPTAVQRGSSAVVGQLGHRARILGRVVGSLSFNLLGRSVSSSRRSWARARR